MAQVKWMFKDQAGDVGVGSAVVPNTVTLAQAVTFANALEAFSDNVLYKVQLVAENETSPLVLPTDGVEAERRGTVLMQSLNANGTKTPFRIGVPGISQACIDKMGKNPAKVSQATKDAIAAAFATMTGLTVTVNESVVSESQR